MSIEATRGYKSSDGVVHGTIEEAQKAELTLLFPPIPTGEAYNAESIVKVLFDQSDAIIAGLRPRSRPRKAAPKAAPKGGRKGGRKPSEDTGE